MIGYLKGKIIHRGVNWLILDVSGVGYKVFSCNMQHVTCNMGDNKGFWIHHHVREDRQELYGFKTIEELEMFELLLRVSGVGPKMALAILSKTELEKIKQAINKGDTTFLTTVAGIGRKLASKIIIELKNKISDFDLQGIEKSEEVLEALQSLGYRKQDLAKVLARMPANLKSTEEKVKWVLKNLQK